MKFIFGTLFLLVVQPAHAQFVEPCFFDNYKHKNKRYINDAEQIIQNKLDELSSLKRNSKHNPNLKTIPVVVHVIHNGANENISDSQILSQIRVLNEDFRKRVGTNGDGDGVDTDIEFCLAQKAPNGRCTNGIIRVNSSLSNHQTYQRSDLKKLSFWDNSRYLNIYVVRDINNGSGTLGYSSFPGGPADEDGIVVRHNYFGTIGTANGGIGRTTTHEIGHWLGLYHTFNGGCGTDTCADGDFVCDTPPVANPNYGCPTNANSCTNDSQPDQVRNYMDYSNGTCQNMFTDGQKNRMIATLSGIRKDISAQWNIDSTGCDSGFVNGLCNVIADFATLTPQICTGNQVRFNNKSQNSPTSFQWYFQGGIPSSSSSADPLVTYPSVGNYEVKLVATNIIGMDSLVVQNYINVVTPPVGQSLPFYEDFETSTFPPNNIIIENADTGVTWELDNIAVAFDGNGSTKINNLINTNYGQSDALVLPNFDFTTTSGIPYLYFRWAYARSDANYSDELIVLASNNCGADWKQIFYRTGNQLVTGPTQTVPYIPDASTVWKSAAINMNAYATYRNVQIKVVNVTDGGNNLYLDNISVGLFPLTVSEQFTAAPSVSIYPIPAEKLLNVEIQDVDNAYVIIYNVIGRIVYVKNITSTHVEVNTTTWDSGIYIFTAKTKDTVYTRKILIK